MVKQLANPDWKPQNCTSDVIRFCRKTSLFVLPVLLILAPPLAILYLSGEYFQNAESVLDEYSYGNVVIGYSQNEQNSRHLKFLRLNSLPRQSVIAVGSSRVLQFRAKMFDRPFYNAGFMAVSLNDLTKFVEILPDEKLPDVLLIGLDQWMFHPDWEATKGNKTPSQWVTDSYCNLQGAIAAVPTTYRDLFRGTISLSALLDSRRKPGFVGLNGIMHRTGFRNDGSYDYGAHTENLLLGARTVRDFQFRSTLKRIATGDDRFEWSSRISDSAVADTRKLLNECKQRGVQVVAFLPPFAGGVFNAMMKSGHYEYIQAIMPAIQDVFREHDAELYEFQTMAACGSSDAEALDGFHGGEVTYVRILKRLVEENSRLSHYVASDLSWDLANRMNDQQVYSNRRFRTARVDGIPARIE